MSEVCSTVNNLFNENSEYVALSIKSPYDTGKTQLIK